MYDLNSYFGSGDNFYDDNGHCTSRLLKTMRMRIILFFMMAGLVVLSSCSDKKKSKEAGKDPVAVIFDTDIGPDYDDVGAISVLHAMADSGECRILATMASNKHRYIAAVLDVMNTYFNRPDIPVGVVRGNAANMEASQKWDSLVVAKYPHDVRSNEEAEDALKLYRKILAAQPDSSVTIITVGFLTNMANLLQSGADEYSAMTGKELVQKKVKQLVCMAGMFDTTQPGFKEFNVKIDSIASKITFDNWPTPIMFSGFEVGVKILTGLPVMQNDSITNSPVKDVFATCIPMNEGDKNGRMSWDETAVLAGVRGPAPYFDIVKGQFVCNVDGSNSWNQQGTRDVYLTIKMPVPEIEKRLNDMIMHQPAARRN